MERGEIWMVALDPIAGSEQAGTRPVMIVSPGVFNRKLRVPIVVPITRGGDFARSAGFAVSLSGAGLKTDGVVRCDQPRALDLRARAGRRIEAAPDYIVDDVLAKVAAIFE